MNGGVVFDAEFFQRHDPWRLSATFLSLVANNAHQHVVLNLKASTLFQRQFEDKTLT
jgi:hypothetical protein